MRARREAVYLLQVIAWPRNVKEPDWIIPRRVQTWVAPINLDVLVMRLSLRVLVVFVPGQSSLQTRTSSFPFIITRPFRSWKCSRVIVACSSQISWDIPPF